MVEPYINFNGCANEAIEFYETVFGGTDKMILKFSDMPSNPEHPVSDKMKNLVAFAKMNICGTRVNFSDMQEEAKPGNMLSFVLRFETTEEVARAYQKIKEGGEIQMEMEPQFYAKMYASVKDKFGIVWQLICE